MDPNLSNLLKWSLANSTPTSNTSPNPAPATSPTSQPHPTSRLPPSALASLLSTQTPTPTDADLLRSSLTTITGPTTPSNPLADKLTAFTTLEQLLESIDNANTLAALDLWPPLVAQLHSPEPEVRQMAAGCVGTAVQNNGGAQERLVAEDAIPTLVRMALEDGDEGVRRKAIYALSSGMRNSQPATDEVVRALPAGFAPGAGGEGRWRVEAGDMEVIDGIMERLRERSSAKRGSG